MIHLGDITKIHGDQIEPVYCITLVRRVKTCPLQAAEQDLRENSLDCSWKRFGS